MCVCVYIYIYVYKHKLCVYVYIYMIIDEYITPLAQSKIVVALLQQQYGNSNNHSCHNSTRIITSVILNAYY